MQGIEFDIPQGRSSVGRDPAGDLTLDDPKVSRVHSYLIRQGDTLTVTDNRSTNGTYVNGERLQPDKPRRLTVDDHLLIGGCEYKLADSLSPPSVHFSPNQPNVTRVIQTDSVAKKLSDILDFYRSHPPAEEKVDTGEAVKIRKLMRSLETVFKMSKRISQVMPLDKLFEEMRDILFEAFEGVENIVFLIQDNDEGAFSDYTPRLIANVHGDTSIPVIIPHSVFHRAIKERVTIVANDALSDERFSASDSIVGLAIRSLMCVPLVLGERVLGALYVDNRTQGINYEESDAELLSAFATQAAVAIDNARLLETLQKSYHQTLQALVKTIEAKDKYTSGHSQRVAQYAIGIGQELQMSDAKLDMLRTAAELHDIGKIGIREIVINKTGKLSDTEYREIKGHPITGESILKPITYLRPILPAIRNHHERWDGKGYPDNQRGDEIHIFARILCVADAFDAMTTQRAYNKPMEYREALDKIRQATGTQFDPLVVEAFGRYVDRLVGTPTGAA